MSNDKEETVLIHSKGSSTAAAQSVWDFLKNIPSRLVGWLQGKFVTIATKIKCFFSGGGSRQSARQSDRTPLVERRVTSGSQKQDDSSLVKTSGSHVTTYGPPCLFLMAMYYGAYVWRI